MCLKACLHGKGDRWYPRFSFFALASAFCFWFISVAPVRGGTHFLCRRKESKQRKRAHTASSCCYPRALHVPIPHATTFSRLPVANPRCDASPTSSTRIAVKHAEPSRPLCGKRCVGERAAQVGAQNVFWQEQRASRCERLHTVCRKWALTKRWCVPLKK